MLHSKDFQQVVKNTPLVSIDLIVQNKKGKILLGKRINEPAKNFWFVPGGRILKDETLDDAFARLTEGEIGKVHHRDSADFLGVYEHFYDNNVFNNKFSTHHVVLAYKVYEDDIILNDQHEEYEWYSIDTLLSSKDVHQHTKDYFMEKRL